MSPAKVIRAALLGCAIAAVAVASAGAGAIVEVNGLILKADGGFQPQSLPERRYAPIRFEGRVDISARKRGARPTPLRQAVIYFDHDGRLSVAGLPTCAPESVANASSEEARSICKGAIVGRGEVRALISLPGGPVPASSPLTIFNGPRLEGNPTAVLHARITVPATETYAIVVPIEKRRRGEFLYRARLDVPPLAGGLGSITHLDVEVGRRYRAGGRARSYVSARCSDNILRTNGRFTFEDGTIIDGPVEKYCHSK